METETWQPTTDPATHDALAPIEEIEQGAFQARIKLGERIFFVGHTRSGKTTLAQTMLEKLIPRRIPIVVIDPKREFSPSIGQGWDIRDDLPWDWERATNRRRRPRHLRLVIRPDYMPDHRKDERLNSIYRRILERGQVSAR